MRVDGTIAGRELGLTGIEELEILLQDDEMFRSIVAGQRGHDVGRGGAAAVVAVRREGEGIPLPGDDVIDGLLERIEDEVGRQRRPRPATPRCAARRRRSGTRHR